MAKILLFILTVVIFIYACGSTSNYEDAKKWYYDCITHRKYHPGDWLAVQDECHKDCTEHFYYCVKTCIEKGYFIAEHLEGGYYSDGSYYATCQNVFENIHPKRDEYEKTEWQEDRDECMELTFENVKPGFGERGERGGFSDHGIFKSKWTKRAKKYYQSCLRERGYNIENLKSSMSNPLK